VGARSIVHEVRTRQDIEQINQLTDSFSQALNQGNADAAYKQFSGRFASMVSFPEFSGRFEQVKKVVKSMKSNRRIDFVIDESTGETVARGMAVTEFPNGADRLEVIYRKEPSGKWTFDKMQFFPEQPQQPPGQAKPAGGAK